MANKASTPNQMKVGGWKVTTDDTSTGSIMDTTRPFQKPYQANRQIGPQSKTNFGRNRDDNKST